MATIPKIVFRYSWIYDTLWESLFPYKKRLKKRSSRQVLNYIKKIEPLWRKSEKKILNELSKIAKLKWKEKEITCYVVGRCIPFSDPLTMPVFDSTSRFTTVLTHELIHQLFIQERNIEKSKRAWRYIDKKYEKGSHTTRIHIPLNAIHSHIDLKFHNKKRLARNMRWTGRSPDYKKSWEIVKKEGYKKILDDFTKRIK